MTRTLPFLLSIVLLAGCFGGEGAPDERAFSAAGGTVSAGYAYDGASIIGRDATLVGTTVDSSNAGSIEVTFLLDDVPWAVLFDRFAQAEGRDFQDGGVEHALDEHGDTGVADAAIPRIHALVAAWGSASVARAGAFVTQEPWSAHLMVSQDSVRGPDGKITKADGTTPYDPARPADARRFEGDLQAILVLRHPMGETFSRGAVGVGANLTCQGPRCVRTAEIAIQDGATRLDLNVTYVPADPLPVAAGRASITIVDADGTVVYDGPEHQIAPGGPPIVEAASAPLEDAVAPLTLILTGDGSFSAQALGTVTYVDHPFIVVTWDEPTVS